MHEGKTEIALVLDRLQRGEAAAADDLFRCLYPELRRIAERIFRSQRGHHTLQATALVGEAFLKMVRPDRKSDGYRDRVHFLAVAATAMRQILVNHARDRSAKKRGGGEERERITLAAVAVGATRDPEVLAVDEALSELESLAPRQSRIAELKFFGGLTNRETAEVLGVSLRTVELDWRMAKSWLAERLAPETGD